MHRGEQLDTRFFARQALVVARALIGVHLERGAVRMRITEVEAYPAGDSASHCRAGPTSRNAPMWGPPGRLYVYLCYGMHNMLNFSTDRSGVGAAVLIRSCEVLAGTELVKQRRGGRVDVDGPGKVGQALAVMPSMSGLAVGDPRGMCAYRGMPCTEMLSGPRVGIDFASMDDRMAPYRFACGESDSVSHRASLSLDELSRGTVRQD